MPTPPAPEHLSSADRQTTPVESSAQRAVSAPPGGRNGTAGIASVAEAITTHPGAWLLLLFLVEALIFYVQAAEQITPFFPMNFDQAGYANYTYQLFDAIRSRGWIALFSEVAHPPTATGTALIIQGALASLFGGASRLTLISINLFYFLLLQGAVARTVFSRTRSTWLAAIALALLASMPTFFNPAGGIFDFRMDFAAQCLYGIWACLILLSDRFADRRLTALATLIAALLVATRSFTLVYAGSVLIGMLIISWIEMRNVADPSGRQRSRVRNTFWSGFSLAVLTLPLMFIARHKIYEKYVIGHAISQEKYIRAEEMKVHSLWEHLTFYPKSVLFDHLGSVTLWLVAALLAFGAAMARFTAPGAMHCIARRVWAHAGDFVVLALCVAIPIAVLTADIAKSTVVGGVVVVPLLLAAVQLIAATAERSAEPHIGAVEPPFTKHRLAPPAWGAALIAVSIVATGSFLAHANAPQHALPRGDLANVNALNEAVASYAIQSGKREPSMSIDRIADYLNIGTAALTAWESQRHILNFRRGMLGDDIFAVPRREAMKLAEESDIVVLTDPLLGRESPYPFNAEIKSYWNDLRAQAIGDKKLLLERDVAGIPHKVYVKPLVNVGGISAGWIVSSGITLAAPASDLRRWPFIVLRGTAPYDVLGGVPQPHAVVADDTNEKTLPAILKRLGNRYEAVIDTRPAAGSTGTLRVHLTFDRSFVPSQRGINDDTRELVMFAPTDVEMIAKAP